MVAGWWVTFKDGSQGCFSEEQLNYMLSHPETVDIVDYSWEDPCPPEEPPPPPPPPPPSPDSYIYSFSVDVTNSSTRGGTAVGASLQLIVRGLLGGIDRVNYDQFNDFSAGQSRRFNFDALIDPQYFGYYLTIQAELSSPLGEVLASAIEIVTV